MRHSRTFDAESAKTAQNSNNVVNIVRHTLLIGINHGRHDALDIAVIEVRIAGRQARNQF